MAEADVKEIKCDQITFHVKEPKTSPTKTALFFALSAHDSLNLPPFCHPVDSLLKMGVRVVSVTLPNHENNERDYGIQEIWKKDKPRLRKFLEDLSQGVHKLTEIFPPPYGALGISRGGFISLHLAARCKDVTTVVGFAPMLSLNEEDEFCVDRLVSDLKGKKIHFYVGDDDKIIGTENVIKLKKALSENDKDGTIELSISPSIGRGGHGTSDPIFNEGVQWLMNQL